LVEIIKNDVEVIDFKMMNYLVFILLILGAMFGFNEIYSITGNTTVAIIGVLVATALSIVLSYFPFLSLTYFSMYNFLSTKVTFIFTMKYSILFFWIASIILNIEFTIARISNE